MDLLIGFIVGILVPIAGGLIGAIAQIPEGQNWLRHIWKSTSRKIFILRRKTSGFLRERLPRLFSDWINNTIGFFLNILLLWYLVYFGWTIWRLIAVSEIASISHFFESLSKLDKISNIDTLTTIAILFVVSSIIFFLSLVSSLHDQISELNFQNKELRKQLHRIDAQINTNGLSDGEDDLGVKGNNAV